MPLDTDKIRVIMTKRGFTQLMLSERCGIARVNIARLLTGGRTDPQLSTVERIAKALRCEIKDIIAK